MSTRILIVCVMITSALAQTNLTTPVTVLPKADHSTTGELRFRDQQTTFHYVAFKAPSSISSNVTWVWPGVDGATGDCMKTNGAGTLTWGSCTGTGGAVDDMFGRAGHVTAQSGDYNSDLVTEGSTNLYFTTSRLLTALAAQTAVGIGTVGYSVSGVLEVRRDQDSSTTLQVTNANVSNSAISNLMLSTGTSNSALNLILHDGNGSPYGQLLAGSALSDIRYDSALHLFRSQAGTEWMRLSSTGGATADLMVGTASMVGHLFVNGGAGQSLIGVESTGNYQTMHFKKSDVTTGLQYWDFSRRADTYFGSADGAYVLDGAYYSSSVLDHYVAPVMFNPNGDVILAGASNAVNGKVAIGSASPNTLLDISGGVLTVGGTGSSFGSSNRLQLELYNSSSSQSIIRSYNRSTSSYGDIGIGEPARFTLKGDTGYVGVGTATPSVKLHLWDGQQSINRDADIGGSGYSVTQLQVGGKTNTNKLLFLGYDTTGNYGVVQASTQFASWDPLALNAGGGNVGVGKTNPGTKLDVAGTTTAYNFISSVATGTAPYASTSTTLNANLNADYLDGYHASYFMPAVSGTGAIMVSSGVPALVSGSGSNCVHADGTSAACGSTQWTTTSSDIYYTTGRVGVGTNSPQYPLHVAGEAVSHGLAVRHPTSASGMSLEPADGSNSYVAVDSFRNDASTGSVHTVSRARGTRSSPAEVQDGDIIYRQAFDQHNGSAMIHNIFTMDVESRGYWSGIMYSKVSFNSNGVPFMEMQTGDYDGLDPLPGSVLFPSGFASTGNVTLGSDEVDTTLVLSRYVGSGTATRLGINASSGPIEPSRDASYDWGSVTYRWHDGWFSGTLNVASIGATSLSGATTSVPYGSTLQVDGGNLDINSTGGHAGGLNINTGTYLTVQSGGTLSLASGSSITPPSGSVLTGTYCTTSVKTITISLGLVTSITCN